MNEGSLPLLILKTGQFLKIWRKKNVEEPLKNPYFKVNKNNFSKIVFSNFLKLKKILNLTD